MAAPWSEVPATWLAEALFGVVVNVIGSGPRLGTEDTITAIASVFLDGARDGTGPA